MTKFARTRKFVDDNRTLLAFCAGSVATGVTMSILTRDFDMLAISSHSRQYLEQGGSVVFELKDNQVVHLVNLKALEAAGNLT